MGYRVSGILKLPDGSPAANAELEFISRKNYTPLLRDLKSNHRCTSSGAYDVTIEYGEYAVIVYPGGTYPAALGTIILSSDMQIGQDLPTLLQQDDWRPATPEYIQQITKRMDRAESAATRSEASAVKSADDGAAQAALAKSQANRAQTEADRASNMYLLSKSNAEVAATQAEEASESSKNASASAIAAQESAETAHELLDGIESTLIQQATSLIKTQEIIVKFHGYGD